MNKIAVSFKLHPKLVAQLKAATKGRYAPTMTAIVERGIELALYELREQSGKTK